MTLREILTILVDAYPVAGIDEAVDLDAGTMLPCYDDLARFLVHEVASLVDARDPADDQLRHVIDAIERAERDLQVVRRAFVRRLRALTDPTYRTVRLEISLQDDSDWRPLWIPAGDLPAAVGEPDAAILARVLALTTGPGAVLNRADDADLAYTYASRGGRPLRPGDAVFLDGRGYRRETDGWTPLVEPSGPSGSLESEADR